MPLADPLRDRVTRVLDATGARSAAELERVLGVSRSSLHGALRTLLASAAIHRVGRGPATNYAACS